MCVAGEIVPEGGAVGCGYHLHAVLPPAVIIRLTMTPVSVSDGRAVTPVIACHNISEDVIQFYSILFRSLKYGGVFNGVAVVALCF